jgi:hypothetical protein
MHSIAYVDVCYASFPKHYFGPRGAAVIVRMSRSVIGSAIGFGFDNLAAAVLVVDAGAEKFSQEVFGQKCDIRGSIIGSR